MISRTNAFKVSPTKATYGQKRPIRILSERVLEGNSWKHREMRMETYHLTDLRRHIELYTRAAPCTAGYDAR